MSGVFARLPMACRLAVPRFPFFYDLLVYVRPCSAMVPVFPEHRRRGATANDKACIFPSCVRYAMDQSPILDVLYSQVLPTQFGLELTSGLSGRNALQNRLCSSTDRLSSLDPRPCRAFCTPRPPKSKSSPFLGPPSFALLQFRLFPPFASGGAGSSEAPPPSFSRGTRLCVEWRPAPQGNFGLMFS